MEFIAITLLNSLSYGLLLFMLSSGLTLIFSKMVAGVPDGHNGEAVKTVTSHQRWALGLSGRTDRLLQGAHGCLQVPQVGGIRS
jgi:hypothetical protein